MRRIADKRILVCLGALALSAASSLLHAQTPAARPVNGALGPAKMAPIIPREDGLTGIAAFAADNKALTPDQTRIAYGISGQTGADRAQALKLIKVTPDSLNFAIDGGGYTLLTWAAPRGEAEVVAAILAQGDPGDMPKITVRQIDMALESASFAMTLSSFGHSPQLEGYVETIRLLLKAGANPQTKDARQLTPLDEALGMAARDADEKKDRLDLVQMLLEHRADPNTLQPDTLASLNDEAVLNLLVAHGLKLERSRSTALLVEAVQHQNHAMVKMALATGADPDVRPAGAHGPLITTADEESAKLLLAAGANPNACWGGTAPPTCGPYGAPLIFKFPKDPELLRLMIAKGANPNAADALGNTVLGHALERGQIVCAVRDGIRQQCLDDAPQRSAAAIILLTAGADPNKRSQGRLPLMLVQDSEHETITLLLDKGARMENTSPEGVSLGPVSMAMATKRPFLAAELLRHSPGKLGSEEKWALFAAAIDGNVALAEGLAQHRTDLNAQAPYGETALHFAAAKGNAAVVRRLLVFGANPNLQTEAVAYSRNGESLNPLVIAAAYAEMKIDMGKQRQYRAAGVEPLERRDGNLTPLMLAAASGNMEVARALLAAGAKTALKSQSGYTALDTARNMGNSQMEQLLAGYR